MSPPPAKLRASPSLAQQARAQGKNPLFGGPPSSTKISPPIKPATPIKPTTTNKFFGRSPLLSKTMTSGKLKSPTGSPNIQTKTDYGGRLLKSPGGKPFKSGISTTVVSPSKFQQSSIGPFTNSQSKPTGGLFQKRIWKSECTNIPPNRNILSKSKFSLSGNPTNFNSSMFKTGLTFQNRTMSLTTNQNQKSSTKMNPMKKMGETGAKKITVKEEAKDTSDDNESDASELGKSMGLLPNT